MEYVPGTSRVIHGIGVDKVTVTTDKPGVIGLTLCVNDVNARVDMSREDALVLAASLSRVRSHRVGETLWPNGERGPIASVGRRCGCGISLRVYHSPHASLRTTLPFKAGDILAGFLMEARDDVLREGGE